MGDLLRNIPVLVVLLLKLGVLLRPVVLDKPIEDPPLEGNGVGHSWFFSLVDGVEYFEGMLPYKLVIAINKEPNLVLLAVLRGSKVQIGYGRHLSPIPNKLDLLLGP